MRLCDVKGTRWSHKCLPRRGLPLNMLGLADLACNNLLAGIVLYRTIFHRISSIRISY